ncbi:hypothetical protein L596_026663 [Steinernema carpocapsae]|uniref:Uncharacterized protein n=1 Tax=Steinernema carpocapsae TaxID=34508 RepID=A0A4U5M207_STECR|nr:hypothetical protein L596_026663 [Steinernema carpocapsae]
MVSQKDRSAIIAHYKRGKPIPKIAKLLKFHRVVQRFQETGKLKDQLKKKVKQKIERNSETNIAKLASKHEVGYAIMYRLTREDLGVKMYKLAKGPALKEEHNASRVEKCLRMRTLARDHFRHFQAVKKRLDACIKAENSDFEFS